MILFLHIFIALGSMFLTAFAYVSPSKTKLRISYGLVAATIITGTYLVIMKLATLTQSWVTGLVYLAIVAVGIVAARNKLTTR